MEFKYLIIYPFQSMVDKRQETFGVQSALLNHSCACTCKLRTTEFSCLQTGGVNASCICKVNSTAGQHTFTPGFVFTGVFQDFRPLVSTPCYHRTSCIPGYLLCGYISSGIYDIYIFVLLYQRIGIRVSLKCDLHIKLFPYAICPLV